jgi:pilus assembly protein TadC
LGSWFIVVGGSWLFVGTLHQTQLDSLVQVVLLVKLFFLLHGRLRFFDSFGLASLSGSRISTLGFLLPRALFLHGHLERHGEIRVQVRVNAAILSELAST